MGIEKRKVLRKASSGKKDILTFVLNHEATSFCFFHFHISLYFFSLGKYIIQPLHFFPLDENSGKEQKGEIKKRIFF